MVWLLSNLSSALCRERENLHSKKVKLLSEFIRKIYTGHPDGIIEFKNYQIDCVNFKCPLGDLMIF